MTSFKRFSLSFRRSPSAEKAKGGAITHEVNLKTSTENIAIITEKECINSDTDDTVSTYNDDDAESCYDSDELPPEPEIGTGELCSAESYAEFSVNPYADTDATVTEPEVDQEVVDYLEQVRETLARLSGEIGDVYDGMRNEGSE